MNWLRWIVPSRSGMSAGWLAQINRPQDHERQPGYLAAMKQIATNAKMEPMRAENTDHRLLADRLTASKLWR